MGDVRPVLHTRVCDTLGIEYPIIQSGMGGIAGPALAAEVSNAGGLGVLAGAFTSPADLRTAIRELRGLTDRPFGVNLLLLPELREPSDAALDAATVTAVNAVLNPIRRRLGLPESNDPPPSLPEMVKPAIEVILEEQVPVFSAGLGDPGRELTARLHDAGTKTVVMVTNAHDARRVVASGADVVVAQGLEAGGHRSHFVKPPAGSLGDIGTLALVPEVAGAVDVPVVAAGGVLDGRGLVAALALGADGVLMGSRFLMTRESMAPEAHKKRLLESGGEDTVLTDVVTGRYARVVRNDLTARARAGARDALEPLPFPAQALAAFDVFGAAGAADEADYLPLWASQAIGRIEDLPWAGDVIAEVVREARALLTGGLAARARWV